MVTSKGYAVTTAYTTPIPTDGGRNYLEIQNRTSGTLFIVFGASTLDTDAITIPPDGFYVPLRAFGSSYKMRSTIAGTVIAVGDNLP